MIKDVYRKLELLTEGRLIFAIIYTDNHWLLSKIK